MKKISLVELLAGNSGHVSDLKIKSDNTLVQATDIGIFEGTSLAYIETHSQIHVLPQQELWFRLEKK